MPGMYPPVSSTLFCSHFSVTRDKELCSYKCELHKWNSVETDVELQSTVLQVGLRSSCAINLNSNFTPKYSGTLVFQKSLCPLTLTVSSALGEVTFTNRKISCV
jgi:hypothetical protein